MKQQEVHVTKKEITQTSIEEETKVVMASVLSKPETCDMGRYIYRFNT